MDLYRRLPESIFVPCVYMVLKADCFVLDSHWRMHPWERLILPLQRPLVVHTSCLLILLLFCSRSCRCSYGRLFHSSLTAILTLTIALVHLLWFSLSCRYSKCDVDVSTETELILILWCLHCVQLWFVVMVSICCKENFHIWGRDM